MFSKNKILLGLLFLSNVCFGQTTKVLDLKKEKGYSESNIISSDTGFKLKQEVCSEEAIDVNYCILLTLIFSDASEAGKLGKIDLSKDTSIVKCIFNWRNDWHWEDRQTAISGFITINKWTKKNVTIDFDIKVYDENFKTTFIYSGERIFTKTRKKDENEWMLR